ncbi:MAG TPA: hypothetical protein VK425_04935 [Acidimicrobiales bacterium]|nr:hypothetical protein [Acidimicrobiales bacterium]
MNPWVLERMTKSKAQDLERAAQAGAGSWHARGRSGERRDGLGLRVGLGKLLIKFGARVGGFEAGVVQVRSAGPRLLR